MTLQMRVEEISTIIERYLTIVLSSLKGIFPRGSEQTWPDPAIGIFAPAVCQESVVQGRHTPAVLGQARENFDGSGLQTKS